MLFASTRGEAPPVSLSAAIVQGLAPDGGLYVPTSWPAAAVAALSPGDALARIAAEVIAPFAYGDALAPHIGAIAAEAFNFPVPLVTLEENLGALELFHGPTAAFKDFGARFLAGCLSHLRIGAARPLRILVATSGDTGGAVAAAFHNRPGVEVAVLFPKGLVSPAQEQQLTCWDGNVRAFEVRGTFDDCQRLVKAAFNDERLRSSGDLTSANSINLGRLLPQMTYYAMASAAAFGAHGERLSFVIPSGNLGNATACVWARKIGFPIGEIVLAHNANCTMVDYLADGEWRPRQSVPTLASAMDVGRPSNAERLFDLWPGLEDMRAAVSAYSVDDKAIGARIKLGDVEYGQVWCPHTATAAEAYARHKQKTGSPGRWAIVATAHAAKFPEIVEPILGRAIALPPALAGLKERPLSKTEIEPDLAALVRELTG